MKTQKSFTLIEILIATTVFIIILIVFITAVWAMLRPRSKTQTMSSLQQSGQAAMDSIAYDVLHANVKVTNYVNFALTDVLSGGPISCVSSCTGRQVTLQNNLRNDGVITKRAFGIAYTDLTAIAIADCSVTAGCACPAGKTCTLIERETDTSGLLTNHSLLPSDVYLTKLEFKGFFWPNSLTPTSHIAPYLTITMTIKSKYTDPANSGELTLRTTVRPIETNIDNGTIIESLTY